MERMFSEPFIAAFEGDADAVEVLSHQPKSITDVASVCYISRCSSGDFGNADCEQERNNFDFLLLPPLTLSAHQTTRVCILSSLDGQNSTPASESLRSPSNDDDDAPVFEAADPRPITTPIPFPVLATVGLLALFWVCKLGPVPSSIRLPIFSLT